MKTKQIRNVVLTLLSMALFGCATNGHSRMSNALEKAAIQRFGPEENWTPQMREYLAERMLEFDAMDSVRRQEAIGEAISNAGHSFNESMQQSKTRQIFVTPTAGGYWVNEY